MTPGGSDSGVRPIFERWDEDVENRDVCRGLWESAGTRKAGRVMSRVGEALNVRRRACDVRIQCLEVSIVVLL